MVTIEITVSDIPTAPDVEPTSTVSETGACDPVATPSVGTWNVRLGIARHSLGTMDIASSGEVHLVTTCFEGSGRNEVVPFGIVELEGFEAATGCPAPETELVRVLSSGEVAVSTDGATLVLSSSASQATFVLERS